MIEILPEERWNELEPIFAQDGVELPNRGRAHILVDVDERGGINAFLVIEMLARVGQVWSGHASAGAVARLIKYIESSMAPESSAIVISTDGDYNGLCEKLQMREVPGQVYRRDF